MLYEKKNDAYYHFYLAVRRLLLHIKARQLFQFSHQLVQPDLSKGEKT